MCMRGSRINLTGMIVQVDVAPGSVVTVVITIGFVAVVTIGFCIVVALETAYQARHIQRCTR